MASTGSAALVSALEQQEAEKQRLEAELAAAEHDMKASLLTEEEIADAYQKARELFLTGDFETKRQLVNLYLDKVLVYSDYVEVYINALPDYIRQKLIKKFRSEGVYALTAEISGRGDGTLNSGFKSAFRQKNLANIPDEARNIAEISGRGDGT
jgi:hypothetical protein